MLCEKRLSWFSVRKTGRNADTVWFLGFRIGFSSGKTISLDAASLIVPKVRMYRCSLGCVYNEPTDASIWIANAIGTTTNLRQYSRLPYEFKLLVMQPVATLWLYSALWVLSAREQTLQSFVCEATAVYLATEKRTTFKQRIYTSSESKCIEVTLTNCP